MMHSQLHYGKSLDTLFSFQLQITIHLEALECRDKEKSKHSHIRFQIFPLPNNHE